MWVKLSTNPDRQRPPSSVGIWRYSNTINCPIGSYNTQKQVKASLNNTSSHSVALVSINNKLHMHLSSLTAGYVFFMLIIYVKPLASRRIKTGVPLERERERERDDFTYLFFQFLQHMIRVLIDPLHFLPYHSVYPSFTFFIAPVLHFYFSPSLHSSR